MAQLHVLYEHAAGYSLFAIKEFEEISMFLPQVESSITDIEKFGAIVKLTGFAPFKSAISALENMNAISEGVVPQDLLTFLSDYFNNLRKEKCTLGIGDSKLGAAITEAIGVQCSHIGVIPELLRGIRFHFHKLVKGVSDKSACIAQLGSDNMIIQSIALLDQLDEDVNTYSMRIREWYSSHFPELIKIIPENHIYAKVIKFIKDRKSLTEEKLPELEEIVMDSAKAQAIIDASKISKGMDISIIDLINIEMLAERIVKLVEYRKELSTYLHNIMQCVAPNLQELIGDQLGARLISHAGSLANLAKYPSSTVQILGSEKAFSRALKTNTSTPKFGLLYHSSYIGRARLKNKGRISRFLANKCSLAARIDCFSEERTNVFGESLKQQVEDCLKFYETGEFPPKNINVMKEASLKIQQQEIVAKQNGTNLKKKNKKKKKVQDQDASIIEAEEEI